MRKLIILLLLFSFSGIYSQQIIQTYTDRCTKATYTFVVAYNSSTVVTFYDRSRVFTAAEFTNGTLQNWLEDTYQWWKDLSPCSANQSNSTNTTNTTSNATSSSNTASNNANSGSSGSSGDSGGGSGDSGGGGDGGGGSDGSDSGGGSDGSDGGGGDSDGGGGDSGDGGGDDSDGGGGDDGGDGGDGDDGGGDGDDGGDGGDGDGDGDDGGDGDGDGDDGDGDDGDEDGDDGDSDGDDEEKKDEDKEEDKEEEEKEEEEKEEEEEEKEEEEKEEESEDEEKEKEKEKKKKKRQPPVVAANLMAVQMIDGSMTTAASFGMSQANLIGTTTYSYNAMIWSNMQQFMVGTSVSNVWWAYDKPVDYYLDNPFTGEKEKFGTFWDKGSIHYVDTNSVNFMYMYGTTMMSYSYSRVWMGQKENKWKGGVVGFAASAGIVNAFGEISSTTSLTGFATKPFTFKALPRYTVAPMLALSLPVTIMPLDLKIIPFENFTYIIGANNSYSLSQRFNANLGINTVHNTDKRIPMTYAFTIGARFAF